MAGQGQPLFREQLPVTQGTCTTQEGPRMASWAALLQSPYSACARAVCAKWERCGLSGAQQISIPALRFPGDDSRQLPPRCLMPRVGGVGVPRAHSQC